MHFWSSAQAIIHFLAIGLTTALMAFGHILALILPALCFVRYLISIVLHPTGKDSYV